MVLLKLALLNIGRNPRRSLITILAVGVGLGGLIFLWGFHDGTANQMRENVIRLFTGHVQIHAKNFEQTLATELTIPERQATLKKIKSDPAVTAVSERVKCEALVGTSEHSRGVLLIGIDPDGEKLVTALHEHLREGEFFGAKAARQILLGDRLAEKIQVSLGDKVVIMTQAVDGTLAGYAYRVQGIFHTGSQQVDEQTAYITLASSRELLGLENESHEFVVRLHSRKDIDPFLNRAQTALPDEAYEILPWNKIVPEPEMWVQWYEAIMRVILTAVMVIIGVGIMNTVLMSVFERTRELGVMMAIGTKPSQIVTLILLETLVLEFFGVILGLAGGYLVVFYFGQVGISFHELEAALSQSYVSTVTYTRVEFRNVIESVIALTLISSLISLYPAMKAGRMEPVKAIYYS